jgi:hypothetical protein
MLLKSQLKWCLEKKFKKKKFNVVKITTLALTCEINIFIRLK